MSEIQKYEQQISLSEQVQYANAVSKAGLLPKQYQNRPADIIVAMGLGQSMGLSPMESIYRINVIQGKPTASAELIAAQVRKAGHKLRISKDEQRQSVTATIIRADDPEAPFSVTRDRKWAQQMGLIGKDNYQKQPMTMLTWRAITAVAREACPEALYGVAYTPDEMHDMDPIEVPAEHVEAREPAEEAVYEAPSHPQRDPRLNPIRERMRPFMDKLGYSMSMATECVLDSCGCKSMDQLTDEDIETAVEYMDGIIEMEAIPDGIQG